MAQFSQILLAGQSTDMLVMELYIFIVPYRWQIWKALFGAGLGARGRAGEIQAEVPRRCSVQQTETLVPILICYSSINISHLKGYIGCVGQTLLVVK